MAVQPKFKILTKFKITPLAAILLQIQNSGGDRPSGGFVCINTIIFKIIIS